MVKHEAYCEPTLFYFGYHWSFIWFRMFHQLASPPDHKASRSHNICSKHKDGQRAGILTEPVLAQTRRQNIMHRKSLHKGHMDSIRWRGREAASQHEWFKHCWNPEGLRMLHTWMNNAYMGHSITAACMVMKLFASVGHAGHIGQTPQLSPDMNKCIRDVKHQTVYKHNTHRHWMFNGWLVGSKSWCLRREKRKHDKTEGVSGPTEKDTHTSLHPPPPRTHVTLQEVSLSLQRCSVEVGCFVPRCK